MALPREYTYIIYIHMYIHKYSKFHWVVKVNERTPSSSLVEAQCNGLKTANEIGAGVCHCYAISICVEIILEKNCHEEQNIIFSDYQAALQAISSVEMKSIMVLECIKMHNSVATE